MSKDLVVGYALDANLFLLLGLIQLSAIERRVIVESDVSFSLFQSGAITSSVTVAWLFSDIYVLPP